MKRKQEKISKAVLIEAFLFMIFLLLKSSNSAHLSKEKKKTTTFSYEIIYFDRHLGSTSYGNNKLSGI
jgi:hypothetical protein